MNPPTADTERLDSWKEIAAYLKRSERTVRRWEATEGLPVHRHLHRKRGTVLAYKSEVDEWWRRRGTSLEQPATTDRPDARRLAVSAAAVVALCAGLFVAVRWARDTPPREVIPAAHDAYLRGQLFMDRTSREGLARAIEAFHRSIDTDPAYAPAYLGLADAYNRSAIHGFLPSREAYPLAKAAVARAAELDSALADAYVLRGAIAFRWDWDWAAAETDLMRALALSPNSSRAHLGYSTYLLSAGRVADAVREARRATDLDALSPQRHVDLAWKLRYADLLDEAMAHARRALEFAPDFPQAHAEYASVLARQGRRDAAVLECDRALALAGQDQVLLSDCGRIYAVAGRREQAMQVIARLERLEEGAHEDAYWSAAVFAALGEEGAVVERLQRAYELRSPNLCFLGIDLQAGVLPIRPETVSLLRAIRLDPAALGIPVDEPRP